MLKKYGREETIVFIKRILNEYGRKETILFIKRILKKYGREKNILFIFLAEHDTMNWLNKGG